MRGLLAGLSAIALCIAPAAQAQPGALVLAGTLRVDIPFAGYWCGIPGAQVTGELDVTGTMSATVVDGPVTVTGSYCQSSLESSCVVASSFSLHLTGAVEMDVNMTQFGFGGPYLGTSQGDVNGLVSAHVPPTDYADCEETLTLRITMTVAGT